MTEHVLTLSASPHLVPVGTSFASLINIPPHGGYIGALKTALGSLSFLIQQWKSQYYVYENLCPHAAMPLHQKDDILTTWDGNLLYCGVHGARFEIDTGLCTMGPCLGQSLRPIKFRISGDQIVSL